jgi:uncharacterized protein (DUF58 family)
MRWLPAGVRRRLRWLRPPRRLSVRRLGWIVVVGSLLIGIAAIATGNNLLFLQLGAVLGFITLSGWLSEQGIRELELRRLTPRATAGRPFRLRYELRSRRLRLPTFSLEVGEKGWEERAFLPFLEAGARAVVAVEITRPRRGVHPLEEVTLGTSFPFGLFHKERDVALPGELLVWPRSDRRVRPLRHTGRRARSVLERSAAAAGTRGDYRSLRSYRPGDDRRDIHWKATARVGEPIVREYARDQGDTLHLCLDLRLPARDGEEAFERAAEICASLAVAAARRGEPFTLTTADAALAAAEGRPHLERALDLLARARPRHGAPLPRLPVAAEECVWIGVLAPPFECADVLLAAAGEG